MYTLDIYSQIIENHYCSIELGLYQKNVKGRGRMKLKYFDAMFARCFLVVRDFKTMTNLAVCYCDELVKACNTAVLESEVKFFEILDNETICIYV